MDFDTTRNLFIEGDNLDALKLLQETIAEISKERIRRAGKKILEEMEPRNTRNTHNPEPEQLSLSKGSDSSVPSVSSVVKNSFEVFFVDENALIACFDTGVNEDLVKDLARFEPLRVVFRDTGFVSDAVKINVEQIFKQLSPHTEVKAI